MEGASPVGLGTGDMTYLTFVSQRQASSILSKDLGTE